MLEAITEATAEAIIEATTEAAATTIATCKYFGTQITQPTIASMPKLTKHTKINIEDIILLNDRTFGYKRDGNICARIDIYSSYGIATRAKSCAVASIVKSINNPKLTAEHIVLA